MNHLSHDCEAVYLGCMDWRNHQEDLGQIAFVLVKKTLGIATADYVSGAGGAKRLLDPNLRESVLYDIGVSREKHHSSKVILTNHTDCGAYGDEGVRSRIEADLHLAKEVVKERFPDMTILMAVVVVEDGGNHWKLSCEPVLDPVAVAA